MMLFVMLQMTFLAECHMKKIYYLSTCDTCNKIIKRLGGLKGYIRQDIKSEPITDGQLEEMKAMAGTYEALFSRRAIKYKEMKLKDQDLNEQDYRRLILQEYTFLKRPVIISGNMIFVGNAESTIEQVEAFITRK